MLNRQKQMSRASSSTGGSRNGFSGATAKGGTALKNGKRAAIFLPNGSVYTGEWKDDVFHGIGELLYRNGNKYEGQFENGVRKGEGVLYVPETATTLKESYRGAWKDGKRHGFGTEWLDNGDAYEGEWVNGNRSGWGVLHLADGDRYEGEWFEGLQHGCGTHFEANGNKYTGGWEYGMKHGSGTHYFTSKNRRLDGEWVDGSMKAGSYAAIDPEPIPGPEEAPTGALPVLGLANPQRVLDAELMAVRQA